MLVLHHFPCVNVFTVKLQRIYQFDNTINRHSPTKYTRNQFSIVPIFFVELFRQTFNGCFVSTFVFKLEIISFVAFFINVLMMRPVVTDLGNEIPSSSSCRPVKIRMDVHPTSLQMQPIFFVVLETYYFRFQYFGAHFYYRRWFARGKFFFLSFLSFWVESKTPEREPSR